MAGASSQAAGGRVYLLQQILFYRELGMPLDEINKILSSKDFDGNAALQSHLVALLTKREQLNLLIANVEKTLSAAKGEAIMSDTEKFEDFKQKLIDANEAKYGEEIRKKYGDEFLAPSLSEGDIVILDNSSVHRAKGVLDSITIRGAVALFLPPYSPDFNPMELLWSKIKAILRKAKARTPDLLIDALNCALASITLEDIENWFTHDGYA